MGILAAAGLARIGPAGPEVEAFSSQRVRSILIGRLRDWATSRARAASPAGSLRALRSTRRRPANRTSGRGPSIHSADVEVE